jgi:hypothetical protein
MALAGLPSTLRSWPGSGASASYCSFPSYRYPLPRNAVVLCYHHHLPAMLIALTDSPTPAALPVHRVIRVVEAGALSEMFPAVAFHF